MMIDVALDFPVASSLHMNPENLPPPGNYSGPVNLDRALMRQCSFTKRFLSSKTSHIALTGWYQGKDLLFDTNDAGDVWIVEKTFRELWLEKELADLQKEYLLVRKVIRLRKKT